MNILYTIEDSLYINITNLCPCKCTFCIRDEGDEVASSGNLWMDHEPSIEEVKDVFNNYSLDEFEEIVFCGYGEPLVRINEVIEIAKFIKNKSDIKVRVNTNGLSDLIHKKDTAIMLSDFIDSVSISLNAPDKKLYNEVTRPVFGEKSFDAMLKFASDCKKHLKEVKFSVVDTISKEQIEKSYDIANNLGIELRVRHKE
nr:TIGR04100 family radical SAM protein [[Clostridium] dakarense]